jgi:kumamolisin
VPNSQRIVLPGSGRRHPVGTSQIAAPLADETIRATVVLFPAAGPEARRKTIRDLASTFPAARKHLKAAEFLRLHGARKSHLKKVEQYAASHGLNVVESSPERRCVVLSGPVSAFARAFAVEFSNHRFQNQIYRSYQGEIQVPSSLGGIVQAVLGLENRELMSHHTFARAQSSTRHVDPAEVAKAYSFPESAKGKGQRIAIIELGGGFYESDIAEYFKKQQCEQRKIAVVEVDGQKNDPAPVDVIKKMLDAMGVSTAARPESALSTSDATRALWTIETTFDIELAGAFATQSEIVVYFAPNNAQGQYHAITTALNSKEHPPDLISCSWGATEDGLPRDFIDSFDQALQDAALRGVTVCVSSGDRGDDSDKDGHPRVHYPASSPHVIACGGTHWVEPESSKDEVVWSEQLPTALAQSGGGVSKVFEEPEWQSDAGIRKKTGSNGRGVPDVSGKADMASGYCMIVGGYDTTMGGTSAAAPMWCGLLALLNEALKHNIGYATPLFYNSAFTTSFHDITAGNNGKHYKAEPGWDACTGLGTPHGNKILAALARD